MHFDALLQGHLLEKEHSCDLRATYASPDEEPTLVLLKLHPLKLRIKVTDGLEPARDARITIMGGDGEETPLDNHEGVCETSLTLDEGSAPSELNTLVVVPLENLGGDAEQETFALGLSQELATGLTRGASGLNIIGLNSQPDNLQETAKKMGASYILSGSLRSSADTFRVTVKLINVTLMQISGI